MKGIDTMNLLSIINQSLLVSYYSSSYIGTLNQTITNTLIQILLDCIIYYFLQSLIAGI